MIERLAIDTNAAVALFRPEVSDPPPLHDAKRVLVPLPVAGELFAGASGSQRRKANLALVERFLEPRQVLSPDLETARTYGEIRAALTAQRLSMQKINDLWIAALCIQHDLPLLTNDRGFDSVPGLTVLHW